MESYRSGHNGAHSKCVSPPGHEGSNPSDSAKTIQKKPEPLPRLFCFAKSVYSIDSPFILWAFGKNALRALLS